MDSNLNCDTTFPLFLSLPAYSYFFFLLSFYRISPILFHFTRLYNDTVLFFFLSIPFLCKKEKRRRRGERKYEMPRAFSSSEVKLICKFLANQQQSRVSKRKSIAMHDNRRRSMHKKDTPQGLFNQLLYLQSSAHWGGRGKNNQQ
jgi:hypothetical protein